MFLKFFIPQTWFAGRIFLSAMLAIAIAGYPILANPDFPDSNSSGQRQQKEKKQEASKTTCNIFGSPCYSFCSTST